MISRAVIDSGPLFSALVLHYADRTADGVNRDLCMKVIDPYLAEASSRQEQFLALLTSIREKLTTSHVIAELNGLQNSRLRLRERELERFWSGTVDLLTQWDLDEQLIRLLDVARRTELSMTRVGLIDAGIIELAQRHGCLLITQDEKTLASVAWRLGVDCRLVKQML